MKIRDLNLDDYVIVYDIGKSEYSEGMTVVGKVVDLLFNNDDGNVGIINSMGNLYEITDNNYFDLWSNSIEDKTESIGDDWHKSVRWIDDNTLQTNLGHKINIPEDMLKDTEFDLDGYVKRIINEMNKKDKSIFKVGLGVSKPTTEYKQSNDVQQRKRNDSVNHPSHYNYGEIEVIDYCDQVCKTYPPELAPYVFNAIKYLSRANHKNGREDIDKAKFYIQRLFDKWPQS